ncbi:hypothetical protein KUTeg_008670, partial [Tegillarca granosa]
VTKLQVALCTHLNGKLKVYKKKPIYQLTGVVLRFTLVAEPILASLAAEFGANKSILFVKQSIATGPIILSMVLLKVKHSPIMILIKANKLDRGSQVPILWGKLKCMELNNQPILINKQTLKLLPQTLKPNHRDVPYSIENYDALSQKLEIAIEEHNIYKRAANNGTSSSDNSTSGSMDSTAAPVTASTPIPTTAKMTKAPTKAPTTASTPSTTTTFPIDEVKNFFLLGFTINIQKFTGSKKYKKLKKKRKKLVCLPPLHKIYNP